MHKRIVVNSEECGQLSARSVHLLSLLDIPCPVLGARWDGINKAFEPPILKAVHKVLHGIDLDALFPLFFFFFLVFLGAHPGEKLWLSEIGWCAQHMALQIAQPLCRFQVPSQIGEKQNNIQYKHHTNTLLLDSRVCCPGKSEESQRINSSSLRQRVFRSQLKLAVPGHHLVGVVSAPAKDSSLVGLGTHTACITSMSPVIMFAILRHDTMTAEAL